MKIAVAGLLKQRAIARGDRARVFDWDKAAHRINEVKPTEASAGLGLDWEQTGGLIYINGDPVMNSYTFLASQWAIPELDMDGAVEPCWKYVDETTWDTDTKWPETSLRILKEGK